MIGAARRFVNGINYPMLITKIYRIYIQPVIQYCSVVWNQNRLTANNVLTLAHKKITRIALNIYHTMDPAKYINYEKRCEILNQDNPSIRRTTQAATLCVKILKCEAILSFSNLIIDHFNINTEARIYHLFTSISREIPPKSPVAYGCSYLLWEVNKFESINFYNRKKIKGYNTSERNRIADSAQIRHLRCRLWKL